MDKKSIISPCLLYEFNLKSNASEAFRNINFAFGEDAVKERTACNWSQRFSLGDENLEDTHKSGRPVSLGNNELRKVVESDSSLTCHELGLTFHVNEKTIRLHMHYIGKRWKEIEYWLATQREHIIGYLWRIPCS